MLRIILLTYLISISINCYAGQDKFYLNKLNNCKITKEVYSDYEPGIFPANNDLLRVDFDKPRIKFVEKIVIRGIILDENCAPVQDAKVYLWQTGNDGKYHYTPLKNKVNDDLIKDDAEESNFLGAGTAITNNQGEFFFITIKPKAVNKTSPKVNIRINHKYLGILDTELTLNQTSIAKDPIEIRQDFIPIIESAEFYDFRIVLKGNSILEY